MTTTSPTGKQWQDQISDLCRLECALRGETYQPIPDRVRGDAGLEGISTDGEGYQCYADQDSVSTGDRVSKQKAKITTDLGKLKKNQEFWEEMFSLCPLKKWIFVTPDVPDKSVILHARRIAKRIRESGLAFVDPSFEAFIVTDEHFQNAKNQRLRTGATRIDVVPDRDTIDLATLASDFVKNTERKLKQVLLPHQHEKLGDRVAQYLTWHLQYSGVQATLFTEHPDLYERLQHFFARQEEAVRFASDIDDTIPRLRLMAIHKSLLDDLDRDFPAFGKATHMTIALGSIASWLGNCPLEFVTELNDA